MFLITGLGNPGTKYEKTRHNVGFEAMDILSEMTGISIKKIKFKGLLGEGVYKGQKLALLKPQTFMNLSGESLLAASDFYKIPPENIIVISDDVSLDAGSLRIRRKGSDGGHNGLKSIIYLLQSDEFIRIKIGVGKKPKEYGDLANWVLGSFSKESYEFVKKAEENAALAALECAINSVDTAMNLYNYTVPKENETSKNGE